MFRALENIQEETLEHFRESAARLVELKGGVDAVAAALAVISGNTEIKARSLLSSREVSSLTNYLCVLNLAH